MSTPAPRDPRYLVYMPLHDLLAARRNPKAHATEAITASIEDHGVVETPAIDERTGRLVAGHGRRGALQRMKQAGNAPPDGVTVREDGEWMIPVLRGWASRDDDDAEKYLLASNQTTIAGGWIKPELTALLADLSQRNTDLVRTGFGQPELTALLSQAGSGPRPVAPSLRDRFLVPPFSVLDARQGYWQDRKRAWLAIGIQSELGRGEASSDAAAPGGGALPLVKAPDVSVRRPGKGIARTFGQDLMRGEHVVGTAKAAGKRLTWVAGNRDSDAMDDTSRKILAAGRRKQTTSSGTQHGSTPPHGASVRQAADGTLQYQESNGTSIFDPVLCELAYRWFVPAGGAVLDPFAGGSVRGIVAARLGYRYTGIELRGEQIAANVAQWEELRPALRTPTPAAPADFMPELSPIERHGNVWAKRDDLFSVAGVQGGKVRSCWSLAQGATGLVTAGSRASPQVNIVAHIARCLGVPCRVHTPEGEPSPEVAAAVAAGAELVQHRAGYNNVIIARAREDAEVRGWANIPFGMECQAAVDATRGQVRNIPAEARRLVVPVGSGMSLAGILWGLRDAGRALPVIGVVVGADPAKRLDKWAPPGWADMVQLVSAGIDYHDEAPVQAIGSLALDPIYEAKCLPFLQDDDCLWCVGIRQTAAPATAWVAAPEPRWIEGDSRNAATLCGPDAAFDFVFSCPPYADLERYSDDPRDLSTMEYDAFHDVYRKIIAEAVRMLRPNRFACFVVGDVRAPSGAYRNFVSHTIAAFHDAGAALYNEAILVTSVGSLPIRAGKQFSASRKLGKTHQQVLVFVKGDPRKATKECGEIDVTFPLEETKA